MPNWKKLIVSGSDANLNSLDVLASITGSTFLVNDIISIADGSNSAPSLRFTDDPDTGIFRSTDNTFNVTVGGTNMFAINSSGITSGANVYSGTNGQFRNYSGVWKGTTGQAGGDAQFILNGKTILHIDEADESVGIGTTTPDTTLELYKETDDNYAGLKITRLKSNSNEYFATYGDNRIVVSDNQAFYIRNGSDNVAKFHDNEIEFYTGGATKRLTIDSTGGNFTGNISGSDVFINDWNSVSASLATLTQNQTLNSSGTVNYVARFESADTITTGVIRDDGSTVGINAAPSAVRTLYIDGTIQATGEAFFKNFDILGTNGSTSRFRDDVQLKFGTNRVFGLQYNSSGDYLEFTSGSNNLVTLLGNGNVGIGTTSTNAKLHLSGSTGSSVLRMESPSTNTLAFNHYTGYSTLRDLTLSNNRIMFFDSGDINFPSNIGIGLSGTTAPSYQLDIDSGTANAAMRIASTDRYTGINFKDSLNNTNLFYDGQEDRLYTAANFRAADIQATGDVTVTGGDITLGTDSIASNINAVGDVLAFKVDSNENTGGTPNLQFKVGASTELTINGSNSTFAGDIAVGPKNNASVTVSESGGATTKLMGASVGRVGTYSNHNFEIVQNSSAAITIDTSKNATFVGDVTVEGTLTAQEFHTEFVSASIIYDSGSTKFGDTSDDVHDFTGSLTVTDGTINLGKIWNPGSGGSIGVYNGSGQQSIQLYGNILRNNQSSLLLNYGVTQDIHAYSSTTSYFTLDASAQSVGIGTTSPNSKLDVRRSNSGIVAEFQSTAGTSDEYVDVKLISGNTTSGTYGTILRHQRVGTSGADFAILTNPTLTGTPVERFRVTKDGALKFNSYGSGTHTGTLAKTLGVDSSGNVIEFTGGSGGGTVSSITSGADNRVAVFNGSDSLEGDADFVFDGTNVGIGTSSPGYKLDIRNAGSSGINISGASSYIRWNAGDMQIRNAGSYAMAFDTWTGSALTEKMRITTDGKVGIGLTAPSTKFQVKSGGADDGLYIVKSDNTNLLGGIIQTGSGDGALVLRNTSNSQVVLLRGNGNNYINGGNVGIGTTSPNEKLHVSGDGVFSGALALGEHTSVDANVHVLDAYRSSPANSSDSIAVKGTRYLYSGTKTGTVYGGYFTGMASNTGTLTTAVGVRTQALASGANASTTNAYSLYSLSPSGTVTNAFNIYATGTAKNYFGGKVGIGTTSPGGLLDVHGDLHVGSGGNKARFKSDGTHTYVDAIPTDSHIVFRNDGSVEKMRLTDNGDLQVTGKVLDADIKVPNQNLLDIDNIKISNRNDLYSNATKTTVDEFKATYANDGTGASTIRLYVDDGVLVDGDNYTVSIYYEGLVGTLSMDWCDTTLTGNHISAIGTTSSPSSGRIYGYASRSDYDSTYRFLDINLTSGASNTVTLFHPKVEAGTVVTDFVGTERTNQEGNSKDLNNLNVTGKVGIGTTSPTYKLDVNGDGRINGVTFVASGATRKISTHSNSGQLQLNGGTDSSGGAYININGSSYSSGRMILYSPESIYLNSDVGIGTTAPNDALQIKGDGKGFYISSTDYNVARIIPRGTGGNLDKGLLSLLDAGVEDIRIDAGGNSWIDTGYNFGIGTTTPQRTLDVNGEIQNNGIFRKGGNVIIKSTGSETMFGPGGSGIITFHNSATMTTSDETMRIDSSGNVLINNTSGNARLDVRQDTGDIIRAENASGQVFAVSSSGDVDISGDLVVAGALTAQEFHTEFVSASIIYESGSTKFGDTSDDVHDFTGSVNVKSLSTGAKLTIEDDTAKTELQHNLHAFRIKVDPNNADTNSNFRVEIDGSEKLRIDNGGDVGIGTTSPSSRLHVSGSGEVIRLQGSTGQSYMTFFQGTGARVGYLGTLGSSGMILESADQLNIYSGGTTTMFLDSNNKVGIGTTSPNDKLHIYSGSLRLENGATSITQLIPGGSGNSTLTFKGGNYVHNVYFDTSWNNFRYARLSSSYNTSDSNFYLYKSDSSGGTAATTTISTGTSTFAAGVTVTGDIDADDITIDDWGSVSASLSAIQTAGGVNGTGTANRLAIWSDSDTLTSDSNLYWNSSNDRLGINVTSPTENLQVNGTAGFGSNMSTNAVKITVNQASTFPGSNASNSRFVDFIGGNSGANTEIGGIRWLNTDSNDGNYQYHAAGITSHNSGSSNDGDLRFFVSSDASADSSTGVIEAVRIDTNGNVGIGTTTPERQLSLYSDDTETTPRLLIEQDGTGDAVMAFSLTGGQGWSMGIDNSGGDAFMIHDSSGGVDSSSQFTILTGGNVGIGTTSPGKKLHVAGEISGSAIQVVGGSSTNKFYSTNTGAIAEFKPSDTRSGMQPIFLYRSSVQGSANYMLANGGTTLFGTYDSGVPSDVSGMIRITPNNSSEAPQILIGDAGSNAASLSVGGNIKLLNDGSSYISGGNVGIGTSSPSSLLHLSSTAPVITGTSTNNSSGLRYNVNGTAQDVHRFQYQGTTQVVIKSTSNVGIGETTPLTRLHVKVADTAGTKSVYGKTLIEDTDAQLDLLSTSAGTWGSAINFIEAAGSSANTDVWSIARKTTGGTGDSSLNFNFGTNNQHDNSNKFKISSAGDITVPGGDITISSAKIKYQQNTDVDSAAAETIASVDTGSFAGAFFDYTCVSGSNARAGTVMAVNVNGSVEFTDNSTKDIGNTSGVTLSVDISGGSMRLRATTTTDNWTINSLVRAL